MQRSWTFFDSFGSLKPLLWVQVPSPMGPEGGDEGTVQEAPSSHLGSAKHQIRGLGNDSCPGEQQLHHHTFQQRMSHWASTPATIFSNCSPNHIKFSKSYLSSYRVICFQLCIAGCIPRCKPRVYSRSNALGLRRGLNWIICSNNNKSNGITQHDQIKVSCSESPGFSFMLAKRTSRQHILFPATDPHV